MSSTDPAPKHSFSLISKIFFALLIGPPVVGCAAAIFSGNYSLGLMLFVFAGLMAIFPLIGLFFMRHQTQGRSNSLTGELAKFKAQYPGYKGKIVFYGIPVATVLVIIVRLAFIS